jgi:cytoskeleton protein RodZ
MSEDFGSYLKHERELRGVPLDEIAQSTKISIRFLRALEESRFEDLPGEVFVKGFIRSYGQAIGSNVDELLAAYDESGSKAQAPETSQMAASPSREEQSERGSGFPMKAVLGFVAALLVIAAGIYWVTFEKGEKTRPSQPAPLTTPSTIDNSLPEIEGDDAESTALEEASAPLSETASPSPEPSPTSPAEPSQPPVLKPDEISTQAAGAPTPIKNTVTVLENGAIIKDLKEQVVSESTESSSEVAMGDSSLKLVIRVNENSWFNLRVDDQRDQDFILPPDGSKTIQAKNVIVITIGNRRATQLVLNGQQLDLPESPDNVIRNLTVNAEQLN